MRKFTIPIQDWNIEMDFYSTERNHFLNASFKNTFNYSLVFNLIMKIDRRLDDIIGTTIYTYAYYCAEKTENNIKNQ